MSETKLFLPSDSLICPLRPHRVRSSIGLNQLTSSIERKIDKDFHQ